jgi:hypothetical protein
MITDVFGAFTYILHPRKVASPRPSPGGTKPFPSITPSKNTTKAKIIFRISPPVATTTLLILLLSFGLFYALEPQLCVHLQLTHCAAL